MATKIITFVAALLLSTFSFAKDFLVLAVPTAAPWVYTQDDGETLTGIDIDVLRTVSRESGYKFEFKPMSYSRSLHELKNGNIDGIAGVSTNYAKVHGFKYIKTPYLSDVTQHIYQRSDEKNIIQKYANLYTRIVGVIKSFSYAEELTEDPLINIEFSEDPNFIFDKIVKKDLDTVVSSDWDVSYYLKSHNLPLHYFVPVTFRSGKTFTSDRSIIFSSKIDNGTISKIQRTMKVLIDDKILDTVLDSYWEQLHSVKGSN